MPPLTYLYTRVKMSLAKLAIVTLLERHDKGLEALAEDLSQILMSEAELDIKYTSALIDYLALREMDLLDDYEEDQIVAEFEDIVKEISQLVLKYRKTMPRFRALHLELPNILIIEYQTEPAFELRPMRLDVRRRRQLTKERF